jgi:hypothetical protein
MHRLESEFALNNTLHQPSTPRDECLGPTGGRDAKASIGWTGRATNTRLCPSAASSRAKSTPKPLDATAISAHVSFLLFTPFLHAK